MHKIVLLMVLSGCLVSAHAQDYVVTRLGVREDSTVIQTAAIQKVIDRVASKGGGTIVFPRGVYLTGALFFKPRTRLRVEDGGRIKGSDDIANYPLLPTRMEGHNFPYYAALINADHADSFSITGPGTIDGNGRRFWEAFWAHRDSMVKAGKEWTNLEVHRPRLIFLWGCNHAVLKDVVIRNSGYWTTHLYQCNDVLIEGCDIRNPFLPVPAPSSDGIDLDVCKVVVIRNCYISVSDDAIAIKGGKGPDAQNLPENGPVEDVIIEHCRFGDSHGTLTLGSECIKARNIVMRDCQVDCTSPLLRIKMRPDTYQTYENITIERITGRCQQVVGLAPWTQFFDLKGRKEKPYGTVRNIMISDINVQCQKFCDIKGNPDDKVSDLLFKNVTVTAEKSTWSIADYPNIHFENVRVNGKLLAGRAGD